MGLSTREKAFNAQSPFDSIKRTGKDGAEYWLARDLMPMLGYGDKWQNFEAAVDRAKIAAEVQGHDVKTLFTSVSKKTGGRPREDFKLTRYAAYLVAMNGDPNKPEVAAAQPLGRVPGLDVVVLRWALFSFSAASCVGMVLQVSALLSVCV